MKCCICEKTVNGYGNNPDPICSIDDRVNRCCDDCNKFVIRARLFNINSLESEPEIGDSLVVFWAKSSNQPIEMIKDMGKFITGEIIDIKDTNHRKEYIGTWGNYSIYNTDSFSIIK